jgi:serine/threonine-protein kinase
MAISSRLQIGDQFDHFQIRNHIARGGMSDIYTAYDLLAGKEVVLKVPDRMSIGDPAQYERFQRELEVMKTLNHPAIQKGLASGTYNNTPYLVTELIKGESLRDFIARSAPMNAEDAIALIMKIADGLLHCHENQIIHRDLKPENILITPEGQPIILDFGLALTKNSHRVTYANLSGAAGTPDYMAPEQIEGHRGDNRTDIYALGIMFYEMLKGEVPFHGDNNLAIMAQHLKGSVPRLDKEIHGLSRQVAAIVSKCLQREPELRYSSLKEFINDLENPDQVDILILDKPTGLSKTASWWRSPVVVSVGTALIILITIIIIALLLQHFHK